MNLHKFLFLAGARFRNPSLWKHYNDLKTSEVWSLEKLKSLQEERLLKFLEYAGTHSNYYKSVFQKTGWVTGKKFTMELFRKIPVVTKSILINKNDAIHTSDQFGKLFNCETSGTSGQVLTFKRDESWDSFNRAAIMRGYSWYKVKPWDYNIYFWGYNFSCLKKIKARFMDFMVNRFRMFNYSENTIKQLTNKIGKAVYIEGYSSMIYELACAAEGKQLNISNLKMVKGTSEKIYPHYQDKIKSVFGKKMISEYGAAETGIIAFECPEGNMHINMEGVYLETDEENEIIVTNFHSRSFPVIRYRLGDAVKLKHDSKPCKCGMAHPIIEEVTGRLGKVVWGIKHKYPSLTFYNIFKNLFFEHGLHLNYQAHQSLKGTTEIWIKENLSEKEKHLIKLECKKYFDDDMQIQLINKSEFRTHEGKLRDFISTLE